MATDPLDWEDVEHRAQCKMQELRQRFPHAPPEELMSLLFPDGDREEGAERSVNS